MEDWSENELDSLWIVVRRDGKGNWEAISADPSKPLSRNKFPQELARRWAKEFLKLKISTATTTKSTTATKNAMRISNSSTDDEVEVQPQFILFGYVVQQMKKAGNDTGSSLENPIKIVNV